MIRRYFLAPLLALAMAAPALAQPHVIAQLGTAPLIGQIDSTQTLQTDVARNERLFATAGTKLGLSASEYRQVRERITESRLAYVTIPRHLDAMTWSSNGRVYVLHDVIIPAAVKGWEVDLRENGQMVAVFIPNKCGNLSVVRKPMPAVAVLPTRVEAARTAPAAPAPVAVEAAATAPPPEAAPAPTPAPYSTLATSSAPAPAPAAAAHHFPWLLLALPVLALVGSHGGGSTHTLPIASTGPIPGGPTPPPVSCPTPVPH